MVVPLLWQMVTWGMGRGAVLSLDCSGVEVAKRFRVSMFLVCKLGLRQAKCRLLIRVEYDKGIDEMMRWRVFAGVEKGRTMRKMRKRR